MQRFVSVVAAGLLGGWTPIAAQSPPSPPPTFDSTVVVTASLERPAPADPVATSDVVDASEIERRQAPRALDLLRTLPGLAVARSGSPGKVASLFTRGATSAQTLVLLDGVVINDPVLGGFDWSTLPTVGLEKVEVIRGPLSTLWGSSAVGGVVQLVTRHDGTSSAAVDLEGGSNALRRGALSGGMPLGRADLRLVAQSRRGDGELPNDGFDADDARLRLDVEAAPNLRVGAWVRVASQETGLPYDFFGMPSPRRAQSADSTQVGVPVDAVAGDWRLELRLSASESDLDLSDPDDPFAASTNSTSREQGRFTATRHRGDGWLGGGVDVERESASTGSAFGPGLADARQDSRAVFAEAGWSGERARVELGARRDEHSESGGETTLRAGAAFRLGASTRLRASWGESFRAPALGDLFFPFFGNPDLEPERGRGWEVGVDLERGAFEGRLVAFENRTRDLIQFDLVRNLPFNIGRARARGLEATARWRREGLAVRLDATRLDAEDRSTGEPLPLRPDWSAALVVDGAVGLWELGGTARTTAERADASGVTLPGYSIVDLRVARRFGARWRPYARVENLLGRDYEEVAGFPAPGRTFAAGLSWRSDG